MEFVAIAASIPLVGGALGAAQESASATAAATRPRSVLFYLVDTCRADRMGFDGYDRATTPFLSWLAERSVVFTSCSSQAPWTKPSMASLLSSRYPSAHGVHRMEQRLPDEVVTWPEILQANGMLTAGFSANVVMGGELSGFAQGFDHFVESIEINRGDPIRFASGSAKKLNEVVFPWLDASERRPTLLYVHSVDPHEEYEPEPSYLALFADPARHARYREDWRALLQTRPPIPGLYVTQDNFDRAGVAAGPFLEHGSDLYDADLRANDDQIRLLFDKLQATGWGDDMILVLTSDHGEEFFEHGGTSHGYSLYEEMLRVPLLIFAPGLLPGGVRIDAPVRSIDVYPTLCELLGYDVSGVPGGLAGSSLVPLFRDEAEQPERDVFAEHREDPLTRRIGSGSGVMTSVRSGRWKLILNEVGSQLLPRPRVELFDLEADPGERVNVADAHPEVARMLEQRIESFRAEQRPDAPSVAVEPMAPETLAQLRALGYVGDAEEGAPDVWRAMATGDPGEVRRSLRAGADADRLDELLGVSPLATAAMKGDAALAEVLLKGGARVDARNRDGSTPLHGAAFLGRPETLELLLANGADPQAVSAEGGTALDATEVPWELTKFLAALLQIPVERGAVEDGRKACAARLKVALEASGGAAGELSRRLLRAVEAGDLAAAEQALDDGADPALQAAISGVTPLSLAAFHGREALARLLLERGAEARGRNRDGTTALHAAALMDRGALIDLLIERGAEVGARDARGSTALHAAAFLGRVDAVERLLRAKADATVRDGGGQAPRDAARVDEPTTRGVLETLGIELGSGELEQGRAKVLKLLGG